MLFHMIVHCVLILLSFLANVADKEPLGILSGGWAGVSIFVSRTVVRVRRP